MAKHNQWIWAVLIGLFIFWLSAGSNKKELFKAVGVYDNTNISLAPNQKLVTANWNGANLWCLTKPMTSIDTVETYEYQRVSTDGEFSGKITIAETKQ